MLRMPKAKVASTFSSSSKKVTKRATSMTRKSKAFTHKKRGLKRRTVVVTPRPDTLIKTTTKDRTYSITQEDEIFNEASEMNNVDAPLLITESVHSISLTPKQNKCSDKDSWLYKLPKYCHSKSFNSLKYFARTTKWNKADFSWKSPLGHGKFGHVYDVTEKKSKSVYALKTLQKEKVLECEVAPTLLKREIEIHSRLQHPNIIKFFGYFHDFNSVNLVIEKASGDMHELLEHQRYKLKEGVAANYIQQIASALKYIHGQNIYHRDLKPENILFSKTSSSCEKITIKLGDFGWSIYAPLPNEMRNTLCGTPEYIPPEMLVRRRNKSSTCRYDVRFIDVWSLGVLAVEMMVGNTPFRIYSTSGKKSKEIQQEIFAKVRSFRKASIEYKKISQHFYDFIMKTMAKDLNQRISIEQVLDHPWIITYVDCSATKTEEMRFKALEITQTVFQKAISKGKVYSTIATRIQESFCKDYGCGWNCIVGKSFGSSVTHEIRTYAYFSVVPGVHVLLWKV